MNSRKYQNIIKHYNGFKGTRTINAILKKIPSELISALTGKQIAQVMEIINATYQCSKRDVSIEDDCIWIGKGINKLVPLKFIQETTIPDHY